jgi:hypothetical protein
MANQLVGSLTTLGSEHVGNLKLDQVLQDVLYEF